jgi:L-ascorbate metabolism protein UlaG (beta-lactamase superfamily)
VTEARLTSTVVGHASFLVQTAGLNILIDPHWSERSSPVSFAGPKRVNDPGIAFEDLPPIDVVLITHNHYDHLDMPTIARLHASHRPRLIAPLGNDAIVKSHISDIRAEAHDWGAAVALSETVRVHLEPCYHWSARGVFDRRMALWSAFVLESPAGRLYHIGDTGFGDGAAFRTAAAKHGRFRLAHLPIGAYEPRWFMKSQHVNPSEAVEIFRISGADMALAHHWGTFQLTDEGIERPPADLAVALKEAAIPAERFRVLRPGDSWSIEALD